MSFSVKGQNTGTGTGKLLGETGKVVEEYCMV